MRALARKLALTLTLAAVAPLLSTDAGAFCGFYVGGGGAKLFNNATQVVLMRSGTRTVLSMQNNYQGPPENFAMVVPVPIVLQKENVKTLNRKLFDHIDQLTSPRLVEYWEQDPCPQPGFGSGRGGLMAPKASMGAGAGVVEKKEQERPAVRIEAQFEVGEYQIVILSADDAMSLDAWLRQNKYNIPEGAEPILRPYVAGGMKFFVAKVDITKVQKDGDRTMLSPLRFHYDSDLFSLPVRLGLLNSSGTQDIIINILAKGQRYEVANYPNVAIPTNIDVLAKTKDQFGTFYAMLFDETVKKKPGAVITEYAWDAGTCDPCPGPALDPREIATLGGDVVDGGDAMMAPMGRGRRRPSGWTVTRLHARYGKDALGEDMVFRTAPAIVGGREVENDKGQLETTAKEASVNNFQARYAIRHRWNGPIKCAHPQRNVWGGPPNGDESMIRPATNLAFVPRAGVALGSVITRGSVEPFLLGAASKVASTIPVGIALPAAVSAAPSASAAPPPPPPPPSAEPAPSAPAPPPPAPATPPKGGCAGCQVSEGPEGALPLLALAALGLSRRRRRP